MTTASSRGLQTTMRLWLQLHCCPRQDCKSREGQSAPKIWKNGALVSTGAAGLRIGMFLHAPGCSSHQGSQVSLMHDDFCPHMECLHHQPRMPSSQHTHAWLNSILCCLPWCGTAQALVRNRQLLVYTTTLADADRLQAALCWAVPSCDVLRVWHIH